MPLRRRHDLQLQKLLLMRPVPALVQCTTQRRLAVHIRKEIRANQTRDVHGTACADAMCRLGRNGAQTMSTTGITANIVGTLQVFVTGLEIWTIQTKGWHPGAILALRVVALWILWGQYAVQHLVGLVVGKVVHLAKVARMRVARTTLHLLLIRVEALLVLWVLVSKRQNNFQRVQAHASWPGALQMILA